MTRILKAKTIFLSGAFVVGLLGVLIADNFGGDAPFTAIFLMITSLVLAIIGFNISSYDLNN